MDLTISDRFEAILVTILRFRIDSNLTISDRFVSPPRSQNVCTYHDGRRIPSNHLLLPAVSTCSSITLVIDTIMGVSSHTREAEAAATAVE